MKFQHKFTLRSFFQKWAKPGLFFLFLFCPFLDTMTNLGQSLTINGKSRGVRTRTADSQIQLAMADQNTLMSVQCINQPECLKMYRDFVNGVRMKCVKQMILYSGNCVHSISQNRCHSISWIELKQKVLTQVCTGVCTLCWSVSQTAWHSGVKAFYARHK